MFKLWLTCVHSSGFQAGGKGSLIKSGQMYKYSSDLFTQKIALHFAPSKTCFHSPVIPFARQWKLDNINGTFWNFMHFSLYLFGASQDELCYEDKKDKRKNEPAHDGAATRVNIFDDKMNKYRNLWKVCLKQRGVSNESKQCVFRR